MVWMYHSIVGNSGNLPAWTSLIESGRKTAEQVIATAGAKAPLTADQQAVLRAITVAEPQE